VVSTLLAPTAGRVRVFGHDPAAEPAAVRRRLGVVFQQAALDDELTVRENLAVQGALVGVTGRALDARAAELLAAFGLADRARSRVKTLSGGLARRADLARGLLHRPALLLLDEPTTGLDPLARRDLWDALDALRRSDGTAQVVATHLMEEAERCDRVGILDRGRLVALGRPDDLKAALGSETLWLEGPAPDRLAALLRERLAVNARAVGRRVLVEAEAPARLLPAVYDAAGPLVEGAAVRRPTLEDVFLAATGRPFEEMGDGL
jgi:ABC-2 type transport system ATP-binding protein